MPQSRSTDRGYLLTSQYRDGSNLSIRMNLHERFSTNGYGWHRWVFDRLEFRPGQQVIELGCGTGALWHANLDRLPHECSVTLSDLSAGMLRESRQQLGGFQGFFAWEVADAQSIPHPSRCFDVVIANHMLYHIPDRELALAEIHRVLAPGGTVYLATNGEAHMRELEDLLVTHVPGATRDDTAQNFSLENGAWQLRQHFSRVVSHLYPDSLRVSEPQPLLDYLISYGSRRSLDDAVLSRLRAVVEQEIERQGAFLVTKSSGLFQCTPPRD